MALERTDRAGDYDPLARQHSLGEEARQAGKDAYLKRDETHRESVRGTVKEAMDKHRKPAMFDPHGIKENLGRARMVRDAMQESIDVGHQGPMRDLPKDKHTDPNQRQGKTVGQSVRLAMAAEKEAARLGLNEKNLERGHVFATESRALQADPHYQANQRSYAVVLQASRNPNSNMSAKDRRECRTPAGLQRVTKRLRKELGFD